MYFSVPWLFGFLGIAAKLNAWPSDEIDQQMPSFTRQSILNTLNQDKNDLKLKYTNIHSKPINKAPLSIWDKTLPTDDKKGNRNSDNVPENNDDIENNFVKYYDATKISKIKFDLNRFDAGSDKSYKYNPYSLYDPQNEYDYKKYSLENDEYVDFNGARLNRVSQNPYSYNSNPSNSNPNVYYTNAQGNYLNKVNAYQFDPNKLEKIDASSILNSILNPIYVYDNQNYYSQNNLTFVNDGLNRVLHNAPNENHEYFSINEKRIDDTLKTNKNKAGNGRNGSNKYLWFVDDNDGVNNNNKKSDSPEYTNGKYFDIADTNNGDENIKSALDSSQNKQSASNDNDKDYESMINYYVDRYKSNDNQNVNVNNNYDTELVLELKSTNEDDTDDVVDNDSYKYYEVVSQDDEKRRSNLGRCCRACKEAFSNACRYLECTSRAKKCLRKECAKSCKNYFDESCSDDY